MKKVQWGSSDLQVPAIVLGCMRLLELSVDEAAKYIDGAMEQGVNFFDHADIYGKGGGCEERFGAAVKEAGIPREQMWIQSKCGIVPGKMFDFSKEHILSSVDASLKRLGTEYLDSLLLHRPDTLMEPEEVAEAFDQLYTSGKVRYFGVSNQNPMQMELLKKCVEQPVMANQLQFSAAHTTMIQSGIEVNMLTDGSLNRDGSVLDYCRVHDVTIQAWSPFQYGMFQGVFLGNEKYQKLNEKIQEIAKKYEVTDTTIATAWILRHPAGMQVLAGTMNQERFCQICKASEITLTREEWYAIYMAAGNILP